MSDSEEPRTATEAQINANRENAQKSSGPRSAEGKEASSRNSLKHGLCANKHLLLDEDPEQFRRLLEELLDRLRPVGPYEERLVLRIANARWRLDRAFNMEAGIFRDRFRDVERKEQRRQEQYENSKLYAAEAHEPMPPPPTPPDEGDLLPRTFNVDCEGANSLAKFSRYEVAIERSIDRCLRQLKAYQALRHTPDAPPTPSESTDCRTNPRHEEDAQSCPTAHNPTDAPAPSPQQVTGQIVGRPILAWGPLWGRLSTPCWPPRTRIADWW